MKTMEKGQSTFAILSDEYADYGKNPDHYDRQERIINQSYQNGFDAAEEQFKPKWIPVYEAKNLPRSVIVSYKFGVAEARYMFGRFEVPNVLPTEYFPGVTHVMLMPDKAQP